MRTPILLAGLLATALVPAAALAQKPPKDPKPNPGGNGAAALTLVTTPNPLVYDSPLKITGRLSGTNKDGGTTVRLESDDTRPYGDAYKATGLTATTAANGAYSFTAKPRKNTQYRVTAQASPPVTSGARLVSVRPLVGLTVSTKAPRKGSLVRFSGIVRPARNGAQIQLQRRGSTGRYVTVARTTLRASTAVQSTYSVRYRVRSSGSYRMKLNGTLELVNGFSRVIALTTR